MVTCGTAAGSSDRPLPDTASTADVLDPRLQALRDRLAAHDPRRFPPAEGVVRASVALVVRPRPTDLDLLLIRRAVAAGDPWSGHMALPGGRRAPQDADGLATAMRETLEEVGVDLQRSGTRLGRLDDQAPLSSGAPRIAISPYVFAAPPDAATTVNHEVDLALWVSLHRLAAPGAATEYIHALAGGQQLRFPAIGYREHVIWGLTYRILAQFFQVAGLKSAGGAN